MERAGAPLCPKAASETNPTTRAHTTRILPFNSITDLSLFR
jgi:hypothetical protein